MLTTILALVAALAGAQQTPSCAQAGVQCIAGNGPLRESSLGLTEALWIGPEERHVYVGSPSVWRLKNTGEVVASHDFFGATTINDTVQVLIDRSKHGTGGASKWEHAGNVSGMYWANLFQTPISDDLYLLGVSSGAIAGAFAASSWHLTCCCWLPFRRYWRAAV